MGAYILAMAWTGLQYMLMFFAGLFAFYIIVAWSTAIATESYLKTSRRFYDKEHKEISKKTFQGSTKGSNEETDSGERKKS